MEHNICHIDIDQYGLKSNCNSKKEDSKILVVNAKPFRLNIIPDIPKESKRKKEKIIKNILSFGKNCYSGKLDNVICEEPIHLVIFKYKKCPICEIEIPNIVRRIQRIRKNNIPIKYEILDVEDKESLNLYKKSGCNGTPCAAMKRSNSKNYIHISEGIEQDIGFYSSLFGIKNPLYIPLTKKTIPKNIVYRKKAL